MPVVFRDGGRKFFFYSEEGDPREPVHVHVWEAGLEAKFWVDPDVRLARGGRFSDRDLREIEVIVTERADEIREKWNDHFSD